MKRNTKLITLLMLLCLFSFLFAIAVSASDGNTDEAYEDGVAENVFATVFCGAKEYATEIFCAMTFTGSLILAYAYKKGLLPLIENALHSIGNAVNRIKEKTEAGEESSAMAATAITEKLNSAENVISALAEKIEKMTAELEEVKDSELLKNRENQNLTLIVSTQIDMLYDIFMTSALPQYQKDAVGERVAKMKEALSANEHGQ